MHPVIIAPASTALSIYKQSIRTIQFLSSVSEPVRLSVYYVIVPYARRDALPEIAVAPSALYVSILVTLYPNIDL